VELLVGNNTRVPGHWVFDNKTGTTFYSYVYGACTLGFNVMRATDSANYFMTAAHCAVEYNGLNGATGDTAFQGPASTRLAAALGIFEVNPSYETDQACPISNRTTMTHYEYCTTADVMVGRYWSGVTNERKVGTSTLGGTQANGQAGTQTIAGWWNITAVLTPEYGDSVGHDTAKSGNRTGTTSGSIADFDTSVPVPLCFVPVSGTCQSTHTLLLQHIGGAYAYAKGGDSGSPVFTRVSGLRRTVCRDRYSGRRFKIVKSISLPLNGMRVHFCKMGPNSNEARLRYTIPYNGRSLSGSEINNVALRTDLFRPFTLSSISRVPGLYHANRASRR
jgi:hypothetical protein